MQPWPGGEQRADVPVNILYSRRGSPAIFSLARSRPYTLLTLFRYFQAEHGHPNDILSSATRTHNLFLRIPRIRRLVPSENAAHLADAAAYSASNPGGFFCKPVFPQEWQ